jgi:23S rRNA (adenine2030-N6)-methyltransferase
VAQVLADALTRFPTGTYAVWYPVLQRNESRQLPERLKRLGAKSWLNVTLAIHGPAPDGLACTTAACSSSIPPGRWKPC